MIKKTLYFGNPAYLSFNNGQLVLRLPEVEKNDSIPTTFKQKAELTIPVEDIGVLLLDHRQITVTHVVGSPARQQLRRHHLRRQPPPHRAHAPAVRQCHAKRAIP